MSSRFAVKVLLHWQIFLMLTFLASRPGFERAFEKVGELCVRDDLHEGQPVVPEVRLLAAADGDHPAAQHPVRNFRHPRR